MKRIKHFQLLPVFLLFCVHTYIHAQCPTGTQSFQNQASVDAFAANYPDCTEINGILLVGGTVENMDGLDAIQKVAGDLIFDGNNGLADISGLNQLDTITGNLLINNNSSVTAISGFERLDMVEGTTIILNNNNLTNISGFDALESLGTLQITTNAALQSISGFGQLTTVGSLEVKNHPELADISGLENLAAVTGNFSLDDNGGLTQVALNNLTTVGGRLSISLNDNLLTISGLQNLMQLGELSLSANNALTTIDGFDELANIDGGLNMLGNIALDDISALNHPIMIGGSAFIISNTLLAECSVKAICDHLSIGGVVNVQNNFAGCNSLAEVTANCPTTCPPGDVVFNTQADVSNYAATYPDCTEINGSLYIGPLSGGTSDITDISGLANLIDIQGDLAVSNNLNLSTIFGLNQIEIIGGDLSIINNNSLTNTGPLESFVTAGGGIIIENNPQLTGLTGFSQIGSISLELRIANNDLLQNINGFAALGSVSTIELSGNASLNDINAFDGLLAIANDLIIQNNPQLSMCSVEGVCNHISTSGNTIVSNNAPNCNSTEQVTTICTVSVEDALSVDDIIVYPNPSNGVFNISGLPQISSEISIYDATGKIIYMDKTDNNTINISEFPAGIYWLTIKMEGNYIYKKILVK